MTLPERIRGRSEAGPAAGTVGLVLDREFHAGGRWVSAYGPYLVEAIRAAFDPVVISSQEEYDRCRKRIRCLFSFEPGWASPRLRYDPGPSCLKAVLYSDPHHEPAARRRYFDENGFDYVLSLYKAPFFRHFGGFPEEKFVHFPWAVPDPLISDHPVAVRSREVAIFGARTGDAYDVRNWCREQEGIVGYDHSGVENKVLSDGEYHRWLARFDAVVAAGSSHPAYGLVTPKYFEIPAAGALLVGQRCEDLDALGFDDANALLFRKDDFRDRVAAYRREPEAYLPVRERGRALIRGRHKLSDRIAILRRLFDGR